MTTPTRAVVLGGGWAGMLTAHVLARHVESVTVVERDILPDGPHHRKGQPQARHVHVLWSSGAGIVENLLPGTAERLLAAGARRIGFQRDLVTLTAWGWQYRFPATAYAMMCTRPLLDWTVRSAILADGRIQVEQGTEAVDLAGDRSRVTGVRVREVDGGETRLLEADLVVDATGRASRLGRWLAALGLPAVEQDVVDAGIGYATRMFKAPEGAGDTFPAVQVAADPLTRQPGRFGVVYPQEGGRWLVTLTSTRGAPLPSQEDEFRGYAKELRHPIVSDLMSVAEPISSIFQSHSGANRRLYPERMPQWPEGLLILGDSLAAFNPVYGHGMSSAARAAEALDKELARDGFGEGGTRQLQRALSEVVDDPWIMAGLNDIQYVNCRNLSRDPRLTGPDTAERLKFSDYVSSKSIRSPKVCEVATGVLSLNAPQRALGDPGFLSLLHSDTSYPELVEPPFRPEELETVGLKPSGTAAKGVFD
ncbi:FAD-dependent monooxygenase [Streptomyces sp. NBS 14/10]|uniref:NAD(P)/FAD-dependent oxidoreductase n=1 Tax=Streptomyces sp. NBS 14/10 TaxID=1945643 RepID=UPI000B7C8C22|nr:FAD-dependent monooxygenase [Streptomyces sp. NBS 14/10]KAK1178080.1 FAD-dependent monooxygenase [Streptomyces sp. NBS 14/10]NUP36650.1 epoxidase [Streptomyces sp.]NUS88038.1 epoxidase [Streptomyces sp.]